MASAQGPIRMYHVTNQRYVDKKEENNHGQPPWNELHLCFPDDKTFDGDLAGLPVVCMTTTVRPKDEKEEDLPETSPYPCKAKTGTVHHRVSVPFHLDSYHLFLIHTFGLQRHVLCLPKVQDCRYIHERVLLVLLQNNSKYKELTAENDYKISDTESLFPVDTESSGTPKPYRANIYKVWPVTEKNFVNVHFVTPVPLPVTAAKWDTVKKSAKGGDAAFGNLIDQGGRTLRQCLVNWIMTAASDEDLEDANRKAVMDGFPADVSLEGSTGDKWTKWKEDIEKRLNGDDMSSVFHAQVQVEGLTAAIGALAVSGAA
eukprot:scpid47577/ scgid30116/ 